MPSFRTASDQIRKLQKPVLVMLTSLIDSTVRQEHLIRQHTHTEKSLDCWQLKGVKTHIRAALLEARLSNTLRDLDGRT